MRPGRKSGRQRGSKSFPALLRGYDVGQRPSAGLTRRSAEAKARDRSVSGMPHNAELAKHQPAARRGYDDLRRAALFTIKNGRLLRTSLSIKFRQRKTNPPGAKPRASNRPRPRRPALAAGLRVF